MIRAQVVRQGLGDQFLHQVAVGFEVFVEFVDTHAENQSGQRSSVPVSEPLGL